MTRCRRCRCGCWRAWSPGTCGTVPERVTFAPLWDDPGTRFIPGTTPRDKGVVMNWFILIVAGLFEIGWAVGLKYTDGFTRPWPTVLTVAAIVISLGLLGVALKTLPVGTAYAVWVGVGAAGTAIAGMLLFAEGVSAGKMVSLAMIVAGIVGLKLTSGA